MIKWIKLKNKISDNPSMIDPYRIMNYRAAKKAWRKQGRLSTWEFMEGARIKAAKTPSEWEALTGIKREYKGDISSATRRWAIALIIIILFSSFMAFTVPGRALAKKLYEVITTFVGNMLYVGTDEYGDLFIKVPQKEADEKTYYEKSIADAFDRIKEPIVYLDGQEYVLNKIVISVSRSKGKSVQTDYDFENVMISIIQRWPPEGTPLDINLNLENGLYIETNTDTNLHYYGSYTEYDKTYFGGTILEKCIVYIKISNVDDSEIINRILNNSTLYSLLNY